MMKSNLQSMSSFQPSPAVAELEARRAAALEMGGPEGLAKQTSLGKLSARDRINQLLDAGSFVEMGMLAGKGRYDAQGRFSSFSPSNSVMGAGQIEGRRIVASADDFTIRGGSPSPTFLKTSTTGRVKCCCGSHTRDSERSR